MPTQKSPWTLVIIALASGTCAAILTAFLMPSPDPISNTRVNPALASEIADLRDRVASMEHTLKALENAPRAPARSAPSVASADAPQKTSAGLNTGPGTKAPSTEALTAILKSDDPEVRETISNAVRDEIAIDREERHLRRVERRKERTREQALEFAERVGLSSGIKDDFVQKLTDERGVMMEKFRALRDGSSNVSREETIKELQEMRTNTDAEVAKLLDQDQYKEYAAERKEEGERMERRWNRRGRGGRDASTKSK